MSFDQLLNQAWTDHATRTEEVYTRFESAISLVEDGKQIPALAQLITHVCGEHLGKWDEGVALLRKLQLSPRFEKKTESEYSVLRLISTLELASGAIQLPHGFSVSDQIRIFAMAASALAGQNNPGKACELFRRALDQAQSGIEPRDPANRALAVTANNLACSLEERQARSETETELMILAAETARKYWEIAGGWLEVQRAEYRLAMTFLCAGDLRLALGHAQSSLEISHENKALSVELFFGYEALARVEKARNNEVCFAKALGLMKFHFEQLSEGDRSWCEASLQKLLS